MPMAAPGAASPIAALATYLFVGPMLYCATTGLTVNTSSANRTNIVNRIWILRLITYLAPLPDLTRRQLAKVDSNQLTNHAIRPRRPSKDQKRIRFKRELRLVRYDSRAHLCCRTVAEAGFALKHFWQPAEIRLESPYKAHDFF